MPAPTTPQLAATAARRDRLAQRIAAVGGGVAIIPTAPERRRNRDTEYAYRFDSYFHYLTGFTEPEAMLVMVVGSDPAAAHSVLFCREKNAEREIWDGFRYGPTAARETFGFDEACPVEMLTSRLPELIGNQPALWYALGYDVAQDARVLDALNTVRAQGRNGVQAPADVRDVRTLLDEMRLFKDAVEVDTMRTAAIISGRAHKRAMRATRPECFEYEIEAELLHEFRRAGSQSVAYNSIVAGGANACVLHYVSNDAQLRDGDLLLIDAGCELDGYASDITRTFPVNGRFSGPQKDVYELVLASQYAALEHARPGQTYDTTHDAAVKVLAQGMIDLGLLSGSLDGVLESGSYRRFYMHRTGHWLGLDVHDAGEYKVKGQWRALEPGMVITVEPGCYIRPGEDVPAAFWNIGVRIEDDVLITASGHDILTIGTPKTVSDIEIVMSDVDDRR
ncbi:MAG: Xaa-Pro aminopeptidase [Rhodocyclales bacterium]|nr:Xaa-Pro aminopeptidase [Rhodocyclales bacterium]